MSEYPWWHRTTLERRDGFWRAACQNCRWAGPNRASPEDAHVDATHHSVEQMGDEGWARVAFEFVSE